MDHNQLARIVEHQELRTYHQGYLIPYFGTVWAKRAVNGDLSFISDCLASDLQITLIWRPVHRTWLCVLDEIDGTLLVCGVSNDMHAAMVAAYLRSRNHGGITNP